MRIPAAPDSQTRTRERARPHDRRVRAAVDDVTAEKGAAVGTTRPRPLPTTARHRVGPRPRGCRTGRAPPPIPAWLAGDLRGGPAAGDPAARTAGVAARPSRSCRAGRPSSWRSACRRRRSWCSASWSPARSRRSCPPRIFARLLPDNAALAVPVAGVVRHRAARLRVRVGADREPADGTRGAAVRGARLPAVGARPSTRSCWSPRRSPSPAEPTMVWARLIAGLLTAVIVGWIWERIGRPEWMRPQRAGARSRARSRAGRSSSPRCSATSPRPPAFW